MKSYKDIVNEVLTKSTPAGEWIKDFVDSDNPKFAGKSAAKRKQMALAAYYAKKNESVEEAAAVSQNSTAMQDMNEDHLVHVSDGSKYDEQPHEKDVEHVMAGVKLHGGEHAGASDKGVFFKFKSPEHAQSFAHHVNKCPHRSCSADLTEAVEYKGIGTDVVDKKKVLNPPIPLTQKKKEVKDFAEAKVYDPITKKMVATKPIKVQAGGSATRNGVPVETGPSKYKQSLKNEGIELIAKHEVKADAPHKSGGHVILTKSSDKWHVLHNKKSNPSSRDLHNSKLLHSYDGEKEAWTKFKELKEDVQIDEVSKATLMRYIPAAARAAAQHTYSGKEAQAWAGHHMRAGDYAASDRQLATSKKELGKSLKRIKGVDTATKKLGTKKTYEQFVHGLELDEGNKLSHALAQTGKSKWHIYDTKTKEVHSTYNNKNVAMKKYDELNDKHAGYDSPGGLVQSKYGVRKEEVQIDEATVSSRKYDWGTMKTVNHGKSFSIPLHPEHHEPIAKLKHGESHSFKDETGRKWKATREHDTVHFHGGSYGTQKTSVPHSSLQESRGHKVLATFFKNREVAQRAYQGNPARDSEVAAGGGSPAEQGIAAAKKDAEKLKKEAVNPALMAILKKRQAAQDAKKAEQDKKKVNESITPAVHAATPKKTKSTAKEYNHATIPGTKRITRAKPDSNEPGEQIKEDQYTSEYKIKYYVDPITGENKTRKIRPHRVDFKASKMRAEPVQKDAQGDYGMKEQYVAEGGFDNYHEIAKELIKRHGKDINTQHIRDIEGERDTHRALDHAEVMHHVKKLTEDDMPKDEKWVDFKKKPIKKESYMLKFNDYLKEAKLSAKQKKIAKIAGDKEKIDADDLAALRAGKKPVDECDYGKMKKEELVGNQYKLDKNKNGKLDADDFKKLRKEETEQIDEISKKTLGSYVNKAAKDSRYMGQIATDFENQGDKARKQSKKDSFERLHRKYLGKSWKREAGIAKAVDKLTKEEVQIDELDKKTIGSYAKKATKDLKWQQTMRPFDAKRISNREKGIDKAIDKLTKEEVEINEGKMKDIYTDMMDHATKKGYSSHKEFTPADYETVGKQHGISGKELAVIAGHKTAQQAANEAVDKVEKDASGKVKSWTHEGDWKKSSEKKDPAGKAANLAGQALKKTKELSKEEVERIEAKLAELDEGVYKSEVEKSFPASGVKTGTSAPKGTSTMPKDKEKAKGQPAGSIGEDEIRFPKDGWSQNDSMAKPVSSGKAMADHAKYFNKVVKLDPKTGKPVKEEVEQEMSPYVKGTLAVMDEGKIDDLRDAQKLRQDTQSAYSKGYKPDTSHPHIKVVKGTAYGGANQKDDEGDEKKADDENQEKRGRGRPAGKVGKYKARGSKSTDKDIDDREFTLHLPK